MRNITKKKDKLPGDFSSLINDAWMDLGDTSKLVLDNPFDQYAGEETGLKLMRVMSDPDYFGFTCQTLLNVDLLPEQMAIMKILWTHPFPMFVASRGAGKCISKSTLITSQRGTHPLSHILPPDIVPCVKYPVNHLKLLGENGYKDVEYVWSNGLSNTITIISNTGRLLTGTYNHPIRVYENEKKNKMERFTTYRNGRYGSYL